MMKRIRDSILDVTGHTPLVRLNNIGKGRSPLSSPRSSTSTPAEASKTGSPSGSWKRPKERGSSAREA